ncbi:MAG: hypothetical protein E5V65_09060 [Mesorhizobium sp.]|nr:MAG: hypothetical protein E5V65_09060 [Mesorhizobium sp.]
MTQKKSLKMLARSRHHLSHYAALSDQVAHGFMIGVGHPDGGQLSGPMKAGKHGGVATFVLTRSPDFRGISDGSTTSHRWPRRVSWRDPLLGISNRQI